MYLWDIRLWVSGFYFSELRDSNPSKCNCPVDSCCRQFKNWWLPFFFPLFEREKCKSNPSSDSFPDILQQEIYTHPNGCGRMYITKIERHTKRRSRLGICTLQIESFPAILHQKTTAGVSLAVVFYLVLQENLSFWSASQF